jgi:hypothetical protein
MHNVGAPSHYPCPPGFNGRLAGIYRFLSGRPMNGHRYTDATFWHPGTMATDLSGRASTYHLWPGWKRLLAIRLPALASPGLAILAVFDWPALVWLATILATLAIPGLAGVARTRVHRREVAEPLAIVLAQIFKKRHVARSGHTWVDIPRDFQDNPLAIARVQVPANWPGDKGEMARVERAVAKKLATDDLVASWDLAGHAPSVQFSRPERPPVHLALSDVLAKVEGLPDDQLAMGVGTRRSLASFSLSTESPHLLIAGGSGAGKSVLLAFLAGQFMRRGYGMAVLDAKHISHMWLRRVPGVLYAAESEELHDALLWIDGEVLRRARFVATGGDPDTLVPLVVVMEEMNAATNRLRSYWQSVKGTGDPMMSPALTAMGNVSSMGRELRIHILMAGQSLTSKATGGAENRENFGGRALARATANQWKMLAPQIKPAPLKRGAPGRWHLVVGDSLKEFQVPFLDIKKQPAEVIAWATGGAPVPDVPAMVAGMSSSTCETPTSPSSEPMSTPTGVSLSEFVAARPGLTLAQVQKWRERHAEAFPEAVGAKGRAQLYDEAALDRFVWARVG